MNSFQTLMSIATCATTPGEYYESGAWGRMGKDGPSFTFGKDGGAAAAAAGRGPRSRGRGDDAPGPGAYWADDAEDGAGDGAGGRTTRGFSFGGGRVGKAWDTAGPGGDAPGPGTYYDDIVKGASTGAAFSFGTGPRSALGGRKAGDALPGPGDYSADTSDVVGRCRLTFSNPR